MVSKQQPWMFVWLVVLIFIVSLESRWSTEGCLEQERFALLQLKPFFNSPYRLENWVEGDHNSDCCQWDRVGCNDTTGRVISLDLFYSRNWEMGEWYLNASLFSPFQQLQSLYLSGNQIAGCVENEGFDKLSTLSNLEVLYLSGNSFNNSILSSLSTLSSLKNLSLSYNKLEGIVDLQGWKLSNLEYLGLSGNIFNNNILSSLSALSSLKTLYLRDVGLEGSIDLPEIFDSLSKLKELDLSNNHINKLVVTKDNGIVGPTNLQFLGLRNVSIHDGSTLLQSLESLPYLKRLDLSYNNFSGNIMSTRELHHFTNLEELTMQGASFHTSLLQSIAAFTSLERLYMLDCQLNGIIGTKDLFKEKKGTRSGLEPEMEMMDTIKGTRLGKGRSGLETMEPERVPDLVWNQKRYQAGGRPVSPSPASDGDEDPSEMEPRICSKWSRRESIHPASDSAVSPFAGVKWSIVLFGVVYRVVLSLPGFSGEKLQ